MNKEFGLLIIWANGRHLEETITKDIELHFNIKYRFEITWSNQSFSKNLTRFYNENLPPKCNKEKDCGVGPFLLFILEDMNPKYAFRKTSKGKKRVNINFFDSKEMYRSWCGGNQIHATNDTVEFRHDIILLLGKNIDDLLCSKYSSTIINHLEEDIVGNNGWDSLKQLFYVLNDTCEYVVLRNFDDLPDIYEVGEHSDIDFLVKRRDVFTRICNANAVYRDKLRSKYEIKVNQKSVYIDVRYVGDGYYDAGWETNILKTRILVTQCFYTPDEENYIYSLLYHGLVQKKKIADEYLIKFEAIFGMVTIKNLVDILNLFLDHNKYKYVEPKDFSVYYNNFNFKLAWSVKRSLYWFKVQMESHLRSIVRSLRKLYLVF